MISFKMKQKFSGIKITDLKDQVKKTSREIQNEKVKDLLDIAYEEVMDVVSLKGRSLSDLERLGHPYAEKHKKIQSQKLLPDPPYGVHERTGSFKRGFNKSFKKATTFSVAVGTIDHNLSKPYHEMIFTGTRVMLPRNPFEVLFTERVRKRMDKEGKK